MGQKIVRFSDLSGQLITEDDALARIVVHDHPQLGDSPVEIEALLTSEPTGDTLTDDDETELAS